MKITTFVTNNALMMRETWATFFVIRTSALNIIILVYEMKVCCMMTAASEFKK